MRKTLLTALSALALLAGSAAVTGSADAAAKPAYKVTLSTSVAKSEAGRFITVAGKVTGPKAAGKTVLIQRHYVGTGWVNVTTAVIKKSGRYAARVETPRGGTTSFRAVKARSSVRKAGASPQRSIPVYEWLYLSHQNGLYDGVTPGVEDTINGKSYPRSLSFGNSNPEVTYKFGKLCTKVSTIALYRFSGSDDPGAQMNLALISTPESGPSVPVSTVLNSGTAVPLTVSSATAKYFAIQTANMDSSYFLTLGDPRAYCNADRLPSWGNGDF